MEKKQVKASLMNYRQSPRKMRLVADLVKGKNAERAVLELGFVTKRAALPIKKLIQSALANAENNLKLSKENLVIKKISVDAGKVLKRSMPRAFGRAAMIRKRTSHINLVLGEPENESAKRKTQNAKATT